MILHWLMHDITQNEQRLRRIEYLAYHDELTGLGNRRMLLGHLHQALARGRRKGRGVAVTCLDLDGFKLINDNLGHAGDELLRQVGARLRHVSRAAETVARLGGDEFTVVIEDLDVSDDPAGSTGPSEPVLAARRIKRALEEPYALAGVEVHVSVSLGISVHPTDARDEATLIEKADAEAYVAKQQARSDPLLAVDDQRGLGGFASLRLLKGLETHRPRPPGGREESSAGVSSSGGRVGKANVETTVLPMTSVAPSIARAAAVARLHGHAQDVVDSVVLLVSELVTSA
jgi:diguanylate cyclase (GGDEF)-like protein